SSNPDITRAIATGIAGFVTAAWSIRLLAEIDDKPGIDLHSAVFRVAIDHQHAPAIGADLGIELIVPGREQRGRHIETLAVEAELNHLRPAGDLDAVDLGRLAEKTTHPHLPGEPGIVRIGDIVLADIAVQPVAEI